MNVESNWDVCSNFLWDSNYVESLDKLFRKYRVKNILDCAGGTGFPSIELKKRGWNVIYTDMSKSMIDVFEQKSKNNNIELEHYNLNWIELSKFFTKKFDVVLCRGNSLIYVDSWGKSYIGIDSLNKIQESLKVFYNLLNKEGFLCIDIINKGEYHKAKYPLIENLGQKIIDGNKVSLSWIINHDYQKKLRIVKSKLTVDKKQEEFTYYSYLLEHKELIKMLKEIGFVKIEEVKLEGEKSYTTYLAFK